MSRNAMNFQNPIIAAQSFDFPFVADAYQGHTMPAGREFLGESDYISVGELVEELRKSKRPSILNIGDSSTSGWDSNVVTRNRVRHAAGQPPIPAFFHYRTYSDCLRRMLDGKHNVINAGVPAHTSLQGSRRVRVLLEFLQGKGVTIEWVTIYYGNNDCVWDHNRQDKNWVGRDESKRGTQAADSRDDPVITRVMPEDYKSSIKDILYACQEFGCAPLIIEPITPIYWKPGTRVLHEDLPRSQHAGSTTVYQLLDEARALWKPAVQQHSYSPLKRVALEEAREKDFVVPRIKRGHLEVLRSVAEEEGVPLVRVELDRTKDDARYFLDYCHPIGEANQLLASRIAGTISSGAAERLPVPERATATSDSLEPDAALESESELPTDHYTLY